MNQETEQKLKQAYIEILGGYKAVLGKRGAITVVDKTGAKVSDNKLLQDVINYNTARRHITGDTRDKYTLETFKETLKKQAENAAKARDNANELLNNETNKCLKELGIIEQLPNNIDMSAECSKDTLVCDALEYMDYTPNKADFRLFNNKIALTVLPDGNTALVIYTGNEANTVKIIADDDSPTKYKDNIRKTLNTIKTSDNATLLSNIRSSLTQVLQDASKAFVSIEHNDFDSKVQEVEQNDTLNEHVKARVLLQIEALKQKSINARMKTLLQTDYPKVVAAAYMNNSKGICILNDISNEDKQVKKTFHGFAVPPVEDVITAARTCFGGLLNVIEYPKVFTNDKDTPCLNYFNLDTVRSCEGTCEIWDEFFNLRVTQEETKVIKAYLWSCIYAKNRSRQILFIWDDGHSGKSTMINVLSKYFGSMCAAAQKDSFNNQFSIAKYWDKHVILFGDTGNSRLHTMDKVKSITGGDDMEVEQKGRSSFKANVYAHIIAASNTPLVIDENEKCETSRLIPIKFKLNTENAIKTGAFVVGSDGKLKPVGDATFEDKLLKQLPAFLKTCEKEYNELCPKDADILLPNIIEERFKTSYGKLDTDDEDMLNEVIREAGFVITDNPLDTVTERTLYSQVITAAKNSSAYECARITPTELKKLLRKRGILNTHTHTVSYMRRATVDYYADLVQKRCDKLLDSNERAIIGCAINSRYLDGITVDIVNMLIENNCLEMFAELTETPLDNLYEFADSVTGLGEPVDYVSWLNNKGEV